jgi:hypothetical protein
MEELIGTPLFELGDIYMTPGVQALTPADILECGKCVYRHSAGDWGECDDHDVGVNKEALERGHRLFSVYTLAGGAHIWIITEDNRRRTTILLPDEY